VCPIVKKWRDAGDIPCRQNHWEEAPSASAEKRHLQPAQTISTSC
jgi:hypothetical protein